MIIQSKRVWVGNQFIPAQIEMKDGIIERVFEYDEMPVDIDYHQQRIVPGFIDVHTHGAFGFDVNDAEEEGLRYWIKNVTKEGVTSILPTTVTQGEEVLTKALKNIVKVVDDGYEGANIVGIHFEGPYLNIERKGAQPPEYIVKSSVEQFKRYQEAANGMIKYVTIASEEDIDFELTRYLSKIGVVASLGHSSATYHQAQMAYLNGVKTMTHVYNGMSPFNHREPNLIGAALNMTHLYGEIIGDCIHSHPASVQTFFNVKGKDKAVLITDSLNVKCAKKGQQYLLGSHKIELYEDGSAHLVDGGSLAGSTLQVNRGLQNLVERAYVPFQDALNSCTINPATILGLQDKKGSIQAGKDADIVVLDDNYDVVQTYVLGKSMI